MAHTHAINPPSTDSVSAGGHTHTLTQGLNAGSEENLGLGAAWGGEGVFDSAQHLNTGGAHVHAVDIASFTSEAVSTPNTGNNTTNPAIVFNSPATTITDSGHSHTVTTTNTGGGLKHQNLSPIIAVNYIIKV